MSTTTDRNPILCNLCNVLRIRVGLTRFGTDLLHCPTCDRRPPKPKPRKPRGSITSTRPSGR